MGICDADLLTGDAESDASAVQRVRIEPVDSVADVPEASRLSTSAATGSPADGDAWGGVELVAPSAYLRRLLATLTPEHVARAYPELAAPHEVTINHARAQYTETRARSGAAIRYAHAVLHRALDQAVAWRLIERNPATGAVLPRRTRPEMRPLTTSEARRLLEVAWGSPRALAVRTDELTDSLIYDSVRISRARVPTASPRLAT